MRGKIDHFADASVRDMLSNDAPGFADEDRNQPMFSLAQVEYLESKFGPASQLALIDMSATEFALAMAKGTARGWTHMLNHIRSIATKDPR